MRNLDWLEKGTRVVFKSEPFELWRTGTVKRVYHLSSLITVVKDGSNSKPIDVKFGNIVGEATDRLVSYPFYWGNVLEHLTEEAKENL